MIDHDADYMKVNIRIENFRLEIIRLTLSNYTLLKLKGLKIVFPKYLIHTTTAYNPINIIKRKLLLLIEIYAN